MPLTKGAAQLGGAASSWTLVVNRCRVRDIPLRAGYAPAEGVAALPDRALLVVARGVRGVGDRDIAGRAADGVTCDDRFVDIGKWEKG